MVDASNPDIRETPGICGGYPRIGDTRIPVSAIVELTRLGAHVDEMLAMYPHLTAEQIRGALAYYETRPTRVDEHIASNARALADLRDRSLSRR